MEKFRPSDRMLEASSVISLNFSRSEQAEKRTIVTMNFPEIRDGEGFQVWRV